jgi:hypothetical protein
MKESSVVKGIIVKDLTREQLCKFISMWYFEKRTSDNPIPPNVENIVPEKYRETSMNDILIEFQYIGDPIYYKGSKENILTYGNYYNVLITNPDLNKYIRNIKLGEIL